MSSDFPTVDAIRQAELNFILNRGPAPAENEPPLWGLALSGGGIRSATFALGVLQVLARNKLLGAFHYISTISGGGYAGAFLQALIRRRGFAGAYEVLQSSVHDAANDESDAASIDAQRPIRHLRAYSNYLSPRKTAVSGDTLGLLGTYVRNLLLVQTQLFTFILLLSLAPLLLFPLMLRAAARWPDALFGVAVILGFVAASIFVWVLNKAGTSQVLEKETSSRKEEAPQGDPPARAVVRGVVISIGLLFLAVLVGATALWGLNTHLFGQIASDKDNATDFTRSVDIEVFALTAGAYFSLWTLWLVIAVAGLLFARDNSEADDDPSPLALHWLRFALATVWASAFAGIALVATRHLFYHWLGIVGLWQALIFGPTCVLLAITLTGIFHIGLAGPALSDLQREVWARVGGRLFAFVALAVGVSCATTVYGPLLLRYGLWFAHSSWLAAGWVGVFGWILTTGSGLLAAYSQRATGDPKSSSKKLEAIARIAPWIFLIGLAIGVSFAGQQILAAAGWDSLPSLNGLKPEEIAPTYLANISRGTLLHYGTLVFVAGLALVLWLTFGYAIDLNEFSLNAFYRNRLVRCYLGASNPTRRPEATTDFDPRDDIVLADIAQQERDSEGHRPLFPIVGTALNLVHTRQLDWQDRKAASFFFTPGYCGYVPPPSHPEAHAVGDTDAAIGATTGCLPSREKDPAGVAPNPNPISAALTLGDVMAISGAAVSPNMGYHSSPAVTLLLTVFDARLGWWLPNPSIRSNSAANVPRFSGWWLITEMLGLTNETGRLIYVSDGGHFDNLGIYELVRRRCRFILAVDAGSDPKRDFADLGDVIQKCRIDFGVDVRIDTSRLQLAADGNSQSCFAVGTIEYPDGDAGTLLYLKPSLVGKEPTDVAHYARAHPTFPHESTADQFFDESQFESYRRLGESVAVAAIEPIVGAALGQQFRASEGHVGLVDEASKGKFLSEVIRAADAAATTT